MLQYSVLMSVYYKEKPEYLRQSIQSMLDQTIPTNDFVIVCDGGLTKALDEVLISFTEEFPGLFQIIKLEKNQGLGIALNIGMKHCKNEIVTRMDSDDISLPNRCERQLSRFENDSSLDIVSGTVAEFDRTPEFITAKKILPENNNEIYQYAKIRCPFNHPAVMYKKVAVQNAGGYQNFPLFEDYYLWIRMLQQNIKAYNIQETLLLMRAGDSMYRRRGGLKYFKKVRAFRKYMLKNRYISWRSYYITIMGQAIMCWMPTSLRTILYRKFLRRK